MVTWWYDPTVVQHHEQDALGTVTGTHEGTSVTQTVSYDAWGVPSVSGNNDSHLMWKGLVWEGDVMGLYYMRGRWYDPELGRFIQEDPIHSGVNDYVFANNDPVNGSDPSGMDPGLQAACAAVGGQYAEFSDGTEVCGVGLGGGPAQLPPVSVTGYQPTSDPSSPFYTPFPGRGDPNSGNSGAQSSYPKIGPRPLPAPKSLLRCEVASVNAGLATGIDATFFTGAKAVLNRPRHLWQD